MTDFLTDKILIANPATSEIPRFANLAGQLVYIVSHSKENAIGICINKNYSKSIEEISENIKEFRQLNAPELASPKVFAGGPVMTNLPWLLTTNLKKQDHQIKNRSFALNMSSTAFRSADKKSICGLGSYGWGEGQLEKEIVNFLWHVIPTDLDTLYGLDFSDEYSGGINLLADLKYGN